MRCYSTQRCVSLYRHPFRWPMCVRAYASGRDGACMSDNLTPGRHREHVIPTARRGKRCPQLRHGKGDALPTPRSGGGRERNRRNGDRRSTLFATATARVSPTMSHLRNSKFEHEPGVFVATSCQPASVMERPADIPRSTVRALPPVCSYCRVSRKRRI